MGKHFNISTNPVHHYIIAVLFIFLFLCAAFRPIGLDFDSAEYLNAIESFYNGVYTIQEPGFIFLAYFSEVFFSSSTRSVFVLYAFISLLIKFYCISKYAADKFVSFIIYACVFFILHDLTQIRAGLAAAFFLWSLPDLINGNKKNYLVKVFLASLFHFSASLLFPLIFLSKQKWRASIYISLPLLSLLLVVLVGDLKDILIVFFSYFPDFISSKAVSYIMGVDLEGRFSDVNVFSKISLSTWGFYLLYGYACSRLRSFSDADNLFLKLFGIMLTIYYLFSSVPVLSARCFELLSVSFIYSLPLLARKFRPSLYLKSIIIFWSILYLYIVNIKLINFEVL
ncbi:EpsG family protein [Aeromonas veronii]|uniref:EpsG family protein n=1 Tax=Aeromonas veronii TaxID=654 RepID=UPI0039F6B742